MRVRGDGGIIRVVGFEGGESRVGRRKGRGCDEGDGGVMDDG